MKIAANMKSAVIALGLVMSLGGCQGAQVARTPASLDNEGFMTAWDAYRHCQAGTNVDAMRHELQQLTRAASAQESADSLSAFLPDFVKRVMDKPASRLAADPKAMAAACALSTGQAALRAERMELATEMFQSVLKNQSQPELAYYVDQARIGLNQVEHGIQFAGSLTGRAPVLMTISASSSTPRNGAPSFLED
jgi:hypothetical protein